MYKYMSQNPDMLQFSLPENIKITLIKF
jgi:hypothetical protein